MNAFSKIFEYGAPEAFQQGRDKRLTRDLGNALADGNYSGAADMALRGGQLETGLKLRGEAETQAAKQKKQEAQQVLRLFQSLQPAQINDYAMQDPVGFERASGMSPEEYLQSAQQMQQYGMTPDQFRQFVIQKAEAELMGDQYVDERNYNRGRDIKADENLERQWNRDEQRWETEQEYRERTFNRDGDWRAEDQEYRDGRDAVTDAQWGSEYNLRKTQAEKEAEAASDYGLNVVWGYDAEGNYVPMQAGKSGGLIASKVPEGVTPLGPGGMAFDSAMGKEEAKKAAYEGAAGQAIIAFENKSNELLGQIDTAMEQTNWMNTGFLGRMVAAGDLDGTLDSIGAKAMLSELIAIKAQGGTLGALSDAEGKALRDAAVNVARSQSEKQLDANLKAYRLQVEKTRDTMKRAFEDEYVKGAQVSRFKPGAAPQAQSQPAIGGDVTSMSDDDLRTALGIQ
jgi:hypothetical protein